MTGTESGGSGMFVERGQDVALVIDDEDEDDGEMGEPPALLPFSQLLLDVIRFADDRRTIAGRFDDELLDRLEFVGEIIVGRFVDEICF